MLGGGVTGRILVVDDEATIRDLAQMILEDAGYQVLTADDGSDAVRIVNDKMPDLVLLDTIMPGMNGLDVCKLLKSQEKTKNIPVVMFTVLGREIDKKVAFEHGCDDYFLKPFAPDELVTIVKKHLKS